MRKLPRRTSCLKVLLAGLPELHEKILQCAAESRIDDDHLAAPQTQDLPDNGADVVHIHLLYDPARLDLSFKCIAQSIKFIGRFTSQQRQLRQNCQLVPSTHLLTPVNLPEARRVVLASRACCRTQTNHLPSLH